MKYRIFPILGSVVEMNSYDFEFRFFNDEWRILLGAKNEVTKDCLVPVNVEVIWQKFKETDEPKTLEISAEVNQYPAKLRLWDVELVDSPEDYNKLDCGGSFLIRDNENRFFLHKIRDGLSVLFYKKNLAEYLNHEELERMHKEAIKDYHELLETPYYDYDDERFDIRMV